MRTIVFIVIGFVLVTTAYVALKLAAPGLGYWHRVLIVLSAYLAGAVIRSIRP